MADIEPGSDDVKQLITRLQLPISDLEELRALLAAPLDALNILPPQFRRYNVTPLPRGALSVSRYLPSIQRALLEHVAPTWSTALKDEEEALILEQYFCPDVFAFSTPAAGRITSSAYSTILSVPFTSYSLHLLTRLTREYPIDRMYSAVSQDTGRTRAITWEDCVRNILAVPAKVANFCAADTQIPDILEHKVFFAHLSTRTECLVGKLATGIRPDISPLVYLLSKLVNIGLFPASPTNSLSPSQPSFFGTTLRAIRTSLVVNAYSTFWHRLVRALPSSLTLRTLVRSLFASIDVPGKSTSGLVKREALLLEGILGHLGAENDELWEVIGAVMLEREWDEGMGRVFVCWVAGNRGDESSLSVLIGKVIDVWTSPEHIKHSLLGQHRYVTTLLLRTITAFPDPKEPVKELVSTPVFIRAISAYVGHLDEGVRRCGLLVAEEVALKAGRQLAFEGWDGEGGWRDWARAVRAATKDWDATPQMNDEDGYDSKVQEIAEPLADTISDEDIEEIITPAAAQDRTTPSPPPVTAAYDSDDSLTGYASPASSRTPSPTPSDLSERARDPTLNVGRKKVQRPVYLAQLGELVRGPGGVNSSDGGGEEADRHEVALACAEDLIRRKRGYGTELEENAVNLVYAFVGMQNNYELDGFEEKRQAAVTALVACCPQKAAPSIIEEFFKNQYSASQRYVMLNALALGARELAALPTPEPRFPSKMLPPAQHQRYLQGDSPVRLLLDDISKSALERGKEDSADKVPELVRERRLRVAQPPKVTELHPGMPRPNEAKKTTFTDVAATYFIAPLINRFWLFLRDEQAREARTAAQEPLYRYYGAGTGLVLNAVILKHFLSTLAVLLHAAQNAPEWLAVLAPDALELAVTLGTQPLSAMEGDDEDEAEAGAARTAGRDGKGKDASVLSTALELGLVVLDGCLERDGGRSLGLEHTALLLGVGEWAGQIFAGLEKGLKVEGGGGMHEVRLRRAAAGVLLKVDELSSRWRRSMVDVR